MENYERGEKLGEGAWGVVTAAVSLEYLPLKPSENLEGFCTSSW